MNKVCSPKNVALSHSEKKVGLRFWKANWTRGEIIIEILKLCGLYLLLSPLVLMPLYNYALFFPLKEHPDPAPILQAIEGKQGVKFKDINFQLANGNKIHGWLFTKPKATKTIIVSHGNAGNIFHRLLLIPTLISCGSSVFIYDYEGYGASEGSPSVQNFLNDGDAAYDYVVGKEDVKPENIILYGESIGCAVTTHIASVRKASAIILQSGFASLKGAAQDRLFFMRLYPDFMLIKPSMDNLSYVAGPHPPLLFIHGDKDDILPSRYSKEMYSKASEPKRMIVLPNAGHNDICTVDMSEYVAGVSQFIRDLDKAKSAK